MKRICFIMPSSGRFLFGGFKVVYEYANRLAADGYNVKIVYPDVLDFSGMSLWLILKSIYRYFRILFNKSYRPDNWFQTDSRIKHIWVFCHFRLWLPRGDIYFATFWSTAFFVDKIKVPPENKFYLIQGFENWAGPTDDVIASYKLNLKKIVISPWLQQLVEDAGSTATLIENGFDFEKFKLLSPIRSRNRHRIIMMYQSTPQKGSEVGLKALYAVKGKKPELEFVLFGTPDRPEKLPEWIEYHQTPDNLCELYNSAAIYVGTSFSEGFGLTVGEAMLCGCAVVCTDAGGYGVMAKNEKTALIVSCGDHVSMCENITRLIEDNQLRFDLAKAGVEFMQRFSWDRAYAELRKVIDNIE